MSVDRIYLQRSARNIEESPSYVPYSKVRIIVGEEEDGTQLVYEAGDDTFRTLEITNPYGTQAIANSILAKIQGYSYKPFKVSGAILNPAAELGDAVNVGEVYSFLSSIDTTFSPVMSADISAPEDSNIDHEYPYESSENKEIARKINGAKASFIVELGRIESSLEEDYQKKSDMSRYVETSSLNTSIGQYIDSTAGTAKVVSAASGVYQRKDQMGNYVLSSSLNTSIGQYIDSQAGTAKIIAAASGTYQTKAEMSGYVKSSTLDTSIGQYLDSSTGQAKIISAASGTYQTKSAMSGYVTASSLNNSIGQYIDSQAGTAKIVAAVSGTYQTKSAMSGYVTTSSLDASITAHINSQSGIAEVTSAVSATYQRKDAMGNYVLNNQLNNSITQYVNSTTGKNAIVASVSGNFAGKSYESRVEISESKIGWLIKSGTSASNFTMTDRAIQLTAGSINLSGYVTFNNLSAAGSTAINGANITTGTINAARINASELKIEKIYSPKSNNLLLYCTDTSSVDTVLHLGAGDNIADVKYIMIQAMTQVMLGAYSNNGLIFNTANRVIYPYSNASSLIWKLGKTDRPFDEVVTNKITLSPSASNTYNISLTATSSGDVYTLTPSKDKALIIGAKNYRLKNVMADVVDANTIGDSVATIAFKTTYGSTAHSITMTQTASGVVFTPDTDNYFEIGTSTRKFKDIYLVSAHIGDNSYNAKISFFGATPIAKQTLSTSSANMGYTSATSSNYLVILNNVVGILSKKYGMFAI